MLNTKNRISTEIELGYFAKQDIATVKSLNISVNIDSKTKTGAKTAYIFTQSIKRPRVKVADIATGGHKVNVTDISAEIEKSINEWADTIKFLWPAAKRKAIVRDILETFLKTLSATEHGDKVTTIGGPRLKKNKKSKKKVAKKATKKVAKKKVAKKK